MNSRRNTLTPFSEDALAAQFADLHADVWRFVPAWGRWLHWTGAKWAVDEIQKVRELVRLTCRAEALNTGDQDRARRIASKRTIDAVLHIAGSDPSLTSRTADWDNYPMHLNTPSGLIDLATGEILEHDPEAMITQITAAIPEGECPLWEGFLEQITDGDTDLAAYLQRVAGYCLTGSTSEQVFFFVHGSGANGKSVFVQTLANVLGDYAATATLDTFMASRATRHLTALAGLRAARLVVVPETDAGRAWAESRIKIVTGGERIRANFMHRDHFEFRPEFKLVVAGNHRPILSNVGEAMRRRLHLVPFSVRIAPEDRDKELVQKLLAERHGILAWMIEGCRQWLCDGLAPPPAVAGASKSYFVDEDVIGQWIDECCECQGALQATAHELFTNWSDWARKSGHVPGSPKSFGEALRDRGFKQKKVAGQRGWLGLGLRRELSSSEVQR